MALRRKTPSSASCWTTPPPSKPTRPASHHPPTDQSPVPNDARQDGQLQRLRPDRGMEQSPAARPALRARHPRKAPANQLGEPPQPRPVFGNHHRRVARDLARPPGPRRHRRQDLTPQPRPHPRRCYAPSRFPFCHHQPSVARPGGRAGHRIARLSSLVLINGNWCRSLMNQIPASLPDQRSLMNQNSGRVVIRETFKRLPC